MKKRMLWVDVLRIIGMVGVILIHVVGNAANTFGVSAPVFAAVGKAAYFVLPVFVMISGMLLLDREIPFRDILCKYIRRMLLVILFFGGAFVFMEEFFAARRISLPLLLRVLRRIWLGDLWAHMWYVYLMIALYLLTPLLRKWVRYADRKEQMYLLAVLYLLTVLKPELKGLLGLNTVFYVPVDTGFVFVFLLGYYLHRFELPRKGKQVLYVAAAGAFAGIFLLSVRDVHSYLVAYDSTLCILVAAGVFCFFQGRPITRRIPLANWITALGECSFGIYILHQFFINVIFKVLRLELIVKLPYLGLMLYALVVMVATFGTVYCLRLIRPVRKYLL